MPVYNNEDLQGEKAIPVTGASASAMTGASTGTDGKRTPTDPPISQSGDAVSLPDASSASVAWSDSATSSTPSAPSYSYDSATEVADAGLSDSATDADKSARHESVEVAEPATAQSQDAAESISLMSESYSFADTITLTRIQATLNTWVAERIHNSPVSRNTAAYNHLVQEIPGLAARLAATLEE